jgi:hypothetical protein
MISFSDKIDMPSVSEDDPNLFYFLLVFVVIIIMLVLGCIG